jgi:nucleotide-binding universal stress UspA family protein
MWQVKKILVPTDGSDMAKLAVEAGIDIAKQNEAEIVALFVVDIPHQLLAHRLEQNIKSVLGEPAVNAVISATEKEGLKAKGLIEQGHAADIIVRIAEQENIDLIVMGTRGASKMKKLLLGLGSSASAVIAHAHCSVLAVRETGRGQESARRKS